MAFEEPMRNLIIGADRRLTSFSRLKLSAMLATVLPLLVSLIVTPLAAQTVVRVGHFPNITHIQGLVAHGLSRQGKGWFESRLGAGTKIEWLVFNAGPSAMEAIFAKSIDFTYVGPSPAINAYARSNGEEVRILAGAVEGGAALVVQPDGNLKTPADFKGKKIATPQLGNTQDVSARSWLVAGGLKITQTGGDAQVIPTNNPDQLLLFKQKQLDAVWTVEPWVSLLESEAGGQVLVDERDAITTLLVTRADLLSSQRELAKKFTAAHRELTDWIAKNPEEAQRIARDELVAETRANVSAELIARTMKRIVLKKDVSREALDKMLKNAQAVGFLRNVPDMAKLVEEP
jgi:NitT/TauT family transport system substrate-binding protein